MECEQNFHHVFRGFEHCSSICSECHCRWYFAMKHAFFAVRVLTTIVDDTFSFPARSNENGPELMWSIIFCVIEFCVDIGC